MSRWHLENFQAATPSNITPGSYTTQMATWASTVGLTPSGTSSRGRVVAVQVGPGFTGQPNATDCSIIYRIGRQTSSGTLTQSSVFPVLQASSLQANESPTCANNAVVATIEPSYATGNVWMR